MSEQHEYDGIKEDDNPLPQWWLMTFYLTIAFSAVYYAYYQLGSGPTIEQELAKELQIEEFNNLSKPKGPNASEGDLLALAQVSDNKSKGKAVFQARCVSCHGEAGQGLIGPNLTDKFWLHGGKATDVFGVIAKGVLEKGMPAWDGVLNKDEVGQVFAYVWSLKNTNAPNGKAAQGSEEKN